MNKNICIALMIIVGVMVFIFAPNVSFDPSLGPLTGDCVGKKTCTYVIPPEALEKEAERRAALKLAKTEQPQQSE